MIKTDTLAEANSALRHKGWQTIINVTELDLESEMPISLGFEPKFHVVEGDFEKMAAIMSSSAQLKTNKYF